MLTLKQVFSGYAMIRVIKEASLEVPTGQAIALVGPNGAGKTTLLETIAGFVTLQGGEIRFNETLLNDLKPEARARLGVVLVSDKRNLFPDLSAAENLRLGRCCAPAKNRWQRGCVEQVTEGVLELFPKLREIYHRPVRLMSGGEQQMVAVGRALMAEPKVLMLDEPSQGLAPKLVQALYEVIRHISSETTVVLVEQDVGLARSVTTNLHLILDGRIRELSAEEVHDDQTLVREIFG